jgi:uncharacterized protein (DUF2336 family)
MKFLPPFLARLLAAPGARYERAKAVAEKGAPAARAALGRSPRTQPEILYYLAARDPDPAVRAAVAGNRATPPQAFPVIAADKSEDVRLKLAARLVKLLPGLDAREHSQLYAYAVQSLGTLALDEVVKVRAALSGALKDKAYAPPKVVAQLARDVEREIAEPVLRYCSALSDGDLLDILSGHPASWAVQAIAGRDKVSARISEAVIATRDAPAGTVLIANGGAEIGEELLAGIVELAREIPEWQAPLARRPKLPSRMARRLADFADAAVRDLLLKRGDFDTETVEDIAQAFRRRLEFPSGAAAGGESAEVRVNRHEREKGEIDGDFIADAVALRDRPLAAAALARRLGVAAEEVERIFALRKAKPVVAMCWKAGLPMRLALEMQKEMAQVHPKELVYPREGSDFPLTEEEMHWQLEFLGVK